MFVISKELGNRLAWASFFGAVCVVFIHAGVAEIEASPLSWWFYHLTANGLCRWAVPFFFAASGFLLAKNAEGTDWYRIALRKRAKSLLIPYFVWSFIGAAVFVILCLGANIKGGRPLFTGFPCGLANLAFFGLYPFDNCYGVLWFLQTLMCFVVLSPLFVTAARRFKWMLPICLFGLSYLRLPSMPFNLNPSWAMFFSAGIVAFMFPLRVGKVCGFLIPIALIWIAWHKYGLAAAHSEHLDVTPLPAVMLLTLGIWSIMPTREMPGRLLGLSFPIYLIHPLFQKLFKYVLKYIFHSPACNTGIYLGVGAAMVFFSICTAKFIRRYKKLPLILFGGR